MAKEWAEIRQEAARAHNKHTAHYRLAMPLLSDYLEQSYKYVVDYVRGIAAMSGIARSADKRV